jgi:mannose-6-phosphate isomerase-like protein (cupin superfamily)
MKRKAGLIPLSDIPFVSKGWGWESWLCNSEKYCGKILFVKKGKQLSWHYHKLKDETFYVQSGEVIVIYGETDDLNLSLSAHLKPGDVFYVPTGLRHRLYGYTDAYVFEFSTEHFDSDSVRIMKGD